MMSAVFTMLPTVLLFALLLIPGYLLGKLGMLDKHSTHSFCNLLMYVSMPLLVFVKLTELELSSVDPLYLALSAFFPILQTTVLLLICALCFGKNSLKRNVSVFCAIFPNCGFLGIPLASVLFSETPSVVLYISVYNVVSTVLLLTVGVFLLSGDKGAVSIKKTLVSPVFIALLLGLLASFSGACDKVPLILTYTQTLAAVTTPLAMISLGISLSGVRLFGVFRVAGGIRSALIKLGAAPILTLLVFLLIKYVFGHTPGTDIMFAMMIASGVSTAATAPAMAEKYSCGAEDAALITLFLTILCVITLPLVYALFIFVF